jgi:hypothetical protein
LRHVSEHTLKDQVSNIHNFFGMYLLV